MGIEVQVLDNASHIHNINVDTLADSTDTQIVKLQLGSAGVDGGLVTPSNPLPVSDISNADIYRILGTLLDRMEYGFITDNAKRLKVTLVDSGALANVTTVGTVSNISAGTITTVGTVNAVTAQTRIGDVQAQRFYEAQADIAFIGGITNNIIL